MSISEFFKGVGEITTATLNVVAEASDALSRSLNEYNLKQKQQRAEMTFTDLRDAIAHVADGKSKYALLNNFIQYEWLREYQEIDGRAVTVGNLCSKLYDDSYSDSDT